MNVSFESVRVTYFKNHENLSLDLGNVTKISGRNGIGKSSIGEAIAWLFFGVDTLGNKLDPTPIGADPEAVTSVEVLARIDRAGQSELKTLFTKQLEKGKAKYFINEVPTKATQYENTIAELFDKNYFLSCFNPIYFFTQHWKEQREQLLKYVSEPIDKEVFEQMPDQMKAETLRAATEKHSIEEAQKIYKPKYAEADKKSERLAERWITLKEQLAQAESETENIDEAAIEEEKALLIEQMANAKKTNNEIQKEAMERERLQYELKSLSTKVHHIKDHVINLQDSAIEENCKTCGQALDAAAVDQTKAGIAEKIQQQKDRGRELMNEYKEKKAAFEKLPDINAGIDAAPWQQRFVELNHIIDYKDRLKPLAKQVDQAFNDKEQIRKEYLQAMSILEAIKQFETVKSELMAEKVGGLFKNLSVKLENEAKNGAVSPCFEVEWSGKPYSKLSTAERIKAGLELITVLSEQSGQAVPVFVDNAESIITFSQPIGQLITATVKNSHLVIKNEEE